MIVLRCFQLTATILASANPRYKRNIVTVGCSSEEETARHLKSSPLREVGVSPLPTTLGFSARRNHLRQGAKTPSARNFESHVISSSVIGRVSRGILQRRQQCGVFQQLPES